MISHIKKNFNNTFNWETFINILNYKYKNNSLNLNENLLKNKSGNNTDILLQGKMYLHIWNLNEKNVEKFLNETDYEKIKKYIKDNFNKNFKVKACINWVGDNDSFIMHSDPQDVLTWQCIGSVDYVIEENGTENRYTINEGDIFYIKSGTPHKVVATGPRASILFDFE